MNKLILVFSFLLPISAYSATELARVNNQALTLEEFNERYEIVKKIYPYNTPSKAVIIEDWINREVTLQAAKKEGLEKDPSVKEKMDAVLAQALLEKRLASDLEKIQPNEKDLKKYYEKNPEVRTSHVFVPVPFGSKPEVEKQAKSVIEEAQKSLKSGKSFAEVVQKYSSGLGSGVGGDLDYQTKDKLDPAYYNAAIALGSPGKVSGIVRSMFGYHIIRLSAVRDWDDVEKSTIQRLFLVEKQNELKENLVNAMRKSASVKINKALISN